MQQNVNAYSIFISLLLDFNEVFFEGSQRSEITRHAVSIRLFDLFFLLFVCQWFVERV